MIFVADASEAAIDALWITSKVSQVGADTIVSLNASESIVLVGVTVTNLTVDNFLGGLA